MNIRHLGAADAVFHPAHHVTQNTLAVVIQLLLNLFIRPVGVFRYRHGEQVVQQVRLALGFQLALNVVHVYLVVV